MQPKRLLTVFAAAAVFAASAVVSNADTWNKKTNLTVKETIEIPGATLPPGEYVVKLVDSQSNRHTVQFLNATEDRVISTVIAIPNRRLQPTGDTEFQWYETPAGQPPALRAWFYPGDNFGQEFAYPENRATALAQQTSQEVRSTTTQPSQDVAAAQQQRQQQQEREAQMAQQEREAELARQRQQQEREAQLAQQREQERQQREREAQMAQQRQQQERDAQLAQQRQQQEREAQLMAQQREQQAQQPELPETAGFGALLALIGLGSVGGAAALRKIRRS